MSLFASVAGSLSSANNQISTSVNNTGLSASFSSFPVPAASSSSSSEPEQGELPKRKKKSSKSKHHRKKSKKSSKDAKQPGVPSTYTITKRADSENTIYLCANKELVPRYKRDFNQLLSNPHIPAATVVSGRHKDKNGAVQVWFKEETLFEARGIDDDNRNTVYFELKKILNRPAVVDINSLLAKKVEEKNEDDGMEIDGAESDFIAVDSLEVDDDGNGLDLVEYFNFNSKSHTSMTEDEFLTAEYTKTNIELNRMLDQDLNNQENWHKLLAHQDTLLTTNNQLTKKQLTSLKAIVSTKKQTIYERMMKCFPNNVDIICDYLSEESFNLSDAEMMNKWESFLLSNESNPKLWFRYIQYRFSVSSSFTVDAMHQVFAGAFDSLKKNWNRKRERKISTEILEAYLLKIQTLHLNFLQESGYIEKAIAILQANIEFSLYVPPAFMGVSIYTRVDLFQVFWESEVTRFGEDGVGKGWIGSLVSDVFPVEPPASPVPELSKIEEDVDESRPYKVWAVNEILLDYSKWYPKRTIAISEVDDIDDINHIPLFIDIKPYLVPIADASNLTKLQSSTFSFLCQVQTGNWGLKQVEKLKRKFFMKAQELVFPFDDTIPLFDVDWKGFFQWFCTNVEGCGAGWDMFLRRVVQQFATLDQQQQGQAGEWDFVDALLEFRENKKSARKQVKKLLKAYQKSLKLWCLYAQIEVHSGNIEEARKVFRTTIQHHAHDDPDIGLVYRMLADLEFEDGNWNLAAKILCDFVDGDGGILESLDDTGLDPIILLKYKELFAAKTSTTTNSTTLIHLFSAYIFFEYLTTQNIIETISLTQSLALNHPKHSKIIYSTQLDIISSQELEDKPSILSVRAFYRVVLDEFPDFWKCWIGFVMLENAKGRTDYANYAGVFDDFLRRYPSHQLWLFYIWSQLQIPNSVNVNFVRSLFDRAVQCETSKKSPLIWFLYLLFVQTYTDPINKNETLKNLYFMGIRDCPWSKDLHMLAFTHDMMENVFSKEEVKDIFSIMEDRGIRKRIESI